MGARQPRSVARLAAYCQPRHPRLAKTQTEPTLDVRPFRSCISDLRSASAAGRETRIQNLRLRCAQASQPREFLDIQCCSSWTVGGRAVSDRWCGTPLPPKWRLGEFKDVASIRTRIGVPQRVGHDAYPNRRSRCGSVRGWPVPSSHFSPGAAPQVGQRTASTLFWSETFFITGR
jgi:hypothetical protein